MVDANLKRCFPNAGLSPIAISCTAQVVDIERQHELVLAVHDFIRMRHEDDHVPAPTSHSTIEVFASCVQGYGRKLQPIRKLYPQAIERGLVVGDWNRPTAGC